MKRNILTRLLCVALLACAPAGLVRCGGTASQLGTETGNPPVIDNQKLRLEWLPNGVRLIGDPGAVPAGAEVQLTNTRTGESATATAAQDGSLRLLIAGTLSDPYEVRVSVAGSETTEPVAGDSGSEDLTTLSCVQLENRLGQTVADSFAYGETTCATTADCVRTPWGGGCYEQCGQTVLSQLGAANARAGADDRAAPICAELGRCTRPPAPTCAPPSTVVSCLEGSCVERSLEALSCQELSAEASQRESAVWEAADQTCTLDQDCSLSFATARCVDDCGYPGVVAASAIRQLTGDIAAAAESICQEFDRQGCVVLPIPCPAPQRNPRAVCRSNRCEVESDTF